MVGLRDRDVRARVCTVSRNGPVAAIVEVRDDHNHVVSASATGEGKENLPPIVTVAFQGASSCTPQIGRPCTLDVVAQASDPEGDALRYAWSGCASGGSSRATCTVERPGPVSASVVVSDDHGHDVRRDLVTAGAGSNQPPGVQIGYITAFPGSFELLGNVSDPDEGYPCGRQYCVDAKTSGACGKVTWFECTCLAGLEVDIFKTASSGICTVTFTLKDSWGQIGTPSYSFDVGTGRPALAPSSAAPASARPGGQR